MALTYSPHGQLGDKLIKFTLPRVEGGELASDTLGGRPTVVMFICNHCPYVLAIEDRLLELGRAYSAQANFVAICANDPTDYPEDAPAELLKRWRAKHYPFPYLVDAAQTVAKAFGAVCTPDLYIYDKAGRLAYRGRLDDSWRKPDQVRKPELKLALDAILAGRPIDSPQNSSMGCSIKWK